MKLKQSPVLTTAVIMVFIIVIYYTAFHTYVFHAPCGHRSVGSFDVYLSGSCLDALIYLSFIFLAACAILLFVIDKRNKYLNEKGVLYCRIVLLAMIPVLFVLNLMGAFHTH